VKTTRPTASRLSGSRKKVKKALKKPVVQLTGDQLEAQSIEENRQRLKALRLARDSKMGTA
jgi:hypothetical protein